MFNTDSGKPCIHSQLSESRVELILHLEKPLNIKTIHKGIFQVVWNETNQLRLVSHDEIVSKILLE